MNLTDEPPSSNEKTFERVAYSSEIYPIEYVPNFHELEYAIPVERGKEAFRQIRELMLTKHTNCIYPVEYRFVVGDSGMLSPYYQRPSVTVSVPPAAPGSTIGAISSTSTRSSGNTERDRIGASCISIAPKTCRRSIRVFMTSRRLRRKMDPSGRFLNDHLRNLFE